MPKLSELKGSDEVILPISDQTSNLVQTEVNSQRTSYSAWAKTGLVFAATTGAFVLAKSTGVLSRMSSWFSKSDKPNIDLDALIARVSDSSVVSSEVQRTDFAINHVDHNVAEEIDLVERFAIGSPTEEFEEVDLLSSGGVGLRRNYSVFMPVQKIKIGEDFSFGFDRNMFINPNNSVLSYTATLINGDDLPSWIVFDDLRYPEDFSGTADNLADPINIVINATNDNQESAQSNPFILSVLNDTSCETCESCDDGVINTFAGVFGGIAVFEGIIVGILIGLPNVLVSQWIRKKCCNCKICKDKDNWSNYNTQSFRSFIADLGMLISDPRKREEEIKFLNKFYEKKCELEQIFKGDGKYTRSDQLLISTRRMIEEMHKEGMIKTDRSLCGCKGNEIDIEKINRENKAGEILTLAERLFDRIEHEIQPTYEMQEFKKNFEEMKELANLEDPENSDKAADAQARLGVAYSYGWYAYGKHLFDKKEGERLLLLAKSRAGKCPAGDFAMGVCYLKGIGGIEKDEGEVIKCFNRSSKKNYAPAQHMKGYCYQTGAGGFEKKNEEAFSYYQKAAKQGHPDAQCNLGCFYEHGIGLKGEKNEKMAIEWYSRAAEQGHSGAKKFLQQIKSRDGAAATLSN